MLTSYIKQCRTRPPLSVIEPGKVPELKPSPVLAKLATLKPGELELAFDDDYSGSDISDPFEDTRNIVRTIKKVRKRLTRCEQSIELMRSFSNKFQDAMSDARKDLQLKSSYHYVDMDQIDKVIEESKHRTDSQTYLEEKLEKMYNNSEYFACGSDLGIPDPNPVAPEKEFDIMSGVWKMLKTTDNLIVSPPGYNAYRQSTPHWLNRDDVKYEVMDSAKSKCEHWLDNQHN